MLDNMLSVGLSIKLIDFQVITEKLHGCFLRCISFISLQKKETTTYKQPTAYTFGNKMRRIEAKYFCLLIWLLKELKCYYEAE